MQFHLCLCAVEKSVQRNAPACIKSLPLFVLVRSTVYFKYMRKDGNTAQHISCFRPHYCRDGGGRGDCDLTDFDMLIE